MTVVETNKETSVVQQRNSQLSVKPVSSVTRDTIDTVPSTIVRTLTAHNLLLTSPVIHCITERHTEHQHPRFIALQTIGRFLVNITIYFKIPLEIQARNRLHLGLHRLAKMSQEH